MLLWEWPSLLLWMVVALACALVYRELQARAPVLFSWTGDNECHQHFIDSIWSLGPRFYSLEYGNTRRDQSVRKYGWAVPTNCCLDCILRHAFSGGHEHASLVDFGAGLGYWSYLLRSRLAESGTQQQQRSMKIFSIDQNPEWYATRKLWCDVKKAGTEALKKLHARVLLLVWPPCWESMAYDAVKAFSGRTVVYVGEGRGGATANASFFDEMGLPASSSCGRSWRLVEELAMLNWFGRHDRLFVFERRDQSADAKDR